MSEEHQCTVCGKEALHRCSGCQSVYYCSREHQRNHWKNHRAACRSYRIERNPNIGRRLIACRDLKAGDVILEEKPLVMGPKHVSVPICLGCYANVDGRIQCDRCGWPTCGRSECVQDDSHHAAECHLISSSGRKIVGSIPVQAYQSVMVLRCLALRDKSPARWEELLQLESHVKERRQNGLEDFDRATILKFLQHTLGLSIPEDLVLQICGVLQVNSYEMPPMSHDAPHGLQAVYSTCSLLEHDCVPNAIKTFKSTGEVIIRAAIPILRGEKIAVCYTEPLWGTVNRQRHLSQTKFFQCKCERCKDPTELETFISGILCPHCPSKPAGVLLPENPLDDKSDWICRECGKPQPASFATDLVETIGKEIIALKKGSIKECEKFISKYSTILHPHHFYLNEVKLALCQMYGRLEGQSLIDMDENVLNKKESLGLELLKIADKISPGMNRLRAIILYELQAVVSVRSRKLVISRDISKEELQAHVKVVRKMLQEATCIFSWEPAETDEGRLAVIASKELHDVDIFLKSLEFDQGFIQNLK